MSVPYLKLEDADGNVYSFPPSMFLTTDPVMIRSSISELLYAHGGRQTGDGFVGSRKLTIEGHVRADTAALFETAYRALVRAVLREGKLSVSDDTVSRYMVVSRPSIESEWEHWPNFKNVTVTFDVDFPFWQAATETATPHVVAGDTSFTEDASGSDHILMPVIEVAADQGVDVPSVKLRNTTDGGVKFEYVNALLVAGATLVIDSQNGTIKLNNNDAIGYYISGPFLRLQPQSNTIYYEGAACTITFKYRKIYL